jgi:hypothetical protein
MTKLDYDNGANPQTASPGQCRRLPETNTLRRDGTQVNQN